jgi:hypothetical protein
MPLISPYSRSRTQIKLTKVRFPWVVDYNDWPRDWVAGPYADNKYKGDPHDAYLFCKWYADRTR